MTDVKKPDQNEISAAVEVVLLGKYYEYPSDRCLASAKGKAAANGFTSTRWDLLKKRYPDLAWDSDYEKSLKVACWKSLPEYQKAAILKKLEIKNISSLVQPVLKALREYEIQDEDVAVKATKLYFLLKEFNRKKEMDRNIQNNALLAQACVNAVLQKKLLFWRFVCLPEISIETAENKFKSWSYSFDNPRYDTLTKALPFDKALIEKVNELDINAGIFFVLDDWEAPWLRASGQYFALPEKQKYSALANLKFLRSDIRRWITQECNNEQFDSEGIVFFSSFVTLDSFLNYIDLFNLEGDEAYEGIFKEEYRFVKEADPALSDLEALNKTKRRIAQYATEGMIIADSFLKNAIYLNSEYPVQVVWKKLTMINSFAALFYLKDEDIKNV